MLINFPPPPPGSKPGKDRLTDTMRTAFKTVVSSEQPAPRLILQSPNGTNYTITVEDDGTLRVRDSRSVPR
jgi:hypothetical protein